MRSVAATLSCNDLASCSGVDLTRCGGAFFLLDNGLSNRLIMLPIALASSFFSFVGVDRFDKFGHGVCDRALIALPPGDRVRRHFQSCGHLHLSPVKFVSNGSEFFTFIVCPWYSSILVQCQAQILRLLHFMEYPRAIGIETSTPLIPLSSAAADVSGFQS